MLKSGQPRIRIRCLLLSLEDSRYACIAHRVYVCVYVVQSLCIVESYKDGELKSIWHELILCCLKACPDICKQGLKNTGWDLRIP
jgi:hypothetical protein